VLSWQVPVDLPNGFSGSITLQTKNAEGLGSVVRTDAFSISFVEPVAPIFALTAVPAQGGINYSFTQAAPTGAQPAVAQVDVWRRQVVSTIPVNTNPSFEVDASDWGNSGFTSVARSTAQFHGGVASLLMTPTGAAALPFALMTTFYPLVAGSRWEMRAWVRAHTTANAVRMYLRWYDVSTTLISSTTRDLTGVADTWLWGYVSGTAPALATSVRLAVGYVGTPLATDLLYADDIQLFPANDDAGTRINANVVAGTTYLDWRATSGVNYEYRGHTTAQNATQADGPWQA
jgi:hypothetical protein